MSKSLETPPGYADLLADIKKRVRTAQVRAALAVNRELILLTGRLAGIFWIGNRPKAGELRSSND